MSQPASNSGAGGGFEAAHRHLLADKTLQFHLDAFHSPQPPAWLGPLARFLAKAAPYLQYVFWAGVAVIVGLVLYSVAEQIVELRGRRRRRKPAPEAAEKPVFRPSAARARALLEDADRLAREGKFGEAVRVLLHRSIDDIEAAFPRSIAPSTTSREIARFEYLPPGGRTAFARLAQAVEGSLFAGRALDATGFAQCREAYAAFALPSAPA